MYEYLLYYLGYFFGWDNIYTCSFTVNIKGKGSCLESRLHDNACSTNFTFSLAM